MGLPKPKHAQASRSVMNQLQLTRRMQCVLLPDMSDCPSAWG